jgi:hypothetical protein
MEIYHPRFYQSSIEPASMTVIHSLLFLLSLATEVGAIQANLMLLLSLLMPEDSLSFYFEFPSVLCTFFHTRLLRIFKL